MKSSTVGRGFDVGIEADTISDGQVLLTTFHGRNTKKLDYFVDVHLFSFLVKQPSFLVRSP
jgi:hypothetical protein